MIMTMKIVVRGVNKMENDYTEEQETYDRDVEYEKGYNYNKESDAFDLIKTARGIQTPDVKFTYRRMLEDMGIPIVELIKK